jgi:hypothetical protein
MGGRIMNASFDANEHVYRNDGLVELIKDAVRFFSGTPVHTLPTPEQFNGAGVYALYYIGRLPIYSKYYELNRLSYAYPIYVGKAVPAGWRQSRADSSKTQNSKKLYQRLGEHTRNIDVVDNLKSSDFMSRFAIFEGQGSDMIGTIEAALIKLYLPLWNIVLDGFGNHTPGAGRFNQAKSDWDVLHKGRAWAEKCKGAHSSYDDVVKIVENHVVKLGK